MVDASFSGSFLSLVRGFLSWKDESSQSRLTYYTIAIQIGAKSFQKSALHLYLCDFKICKFKSLESWKIREMTSYLIRNIIKVIFLKKIFYLTVQYNKKESNFISIFVCNRHCCSVNRKFSRIFYDGTYTHKKLVKPEQDTTVFFFCFDDFLSESYVTAMKKF